MPIGHILKNTAIRLGLKLQSSTPEKIQAIIIDLSDFMSARQPAGE